MSAIDEREWWIEASRRWGFSPSLPFELEQMSRGSGWPGHQANRLIRTLIERLEGREENSEDATIKRKGRVS